MVQSQGGGGGLPSGYRRVNSLVVSNTTTSYGGGIITDYVFGNQFDKVEVFVNADALSDVTSNSNVIGTNNLYYTLAAQYKIRYYYGWGGRNRTIETPIRKIALHVDRSIFVNGEYIDKTTYNGGDVLDTCLLYLFTDRYKRTPQKNMIFGKAVLYKNDDVVCEYIPCEEESTSKIGWYNTMECAFIEAQIAEWAESSFSFDE